MNPIKIIECGSCSCYHRVNYYGDCRNDNERFADLQDAANHLQKPVIETFADGSYIDASVLPEQIFLTSRQAEKLSEFRQPKTIWE